MVICINTEKGIVSSKGHLQRYTSSIELAVQKELTICTEPYVPFIEKDLRSDASGGYWKSVAKKDLQKFIKIGKVKKVFKTWGHNGMMADGAVYFQATV